MHQHVYTTIMYSYTIYNLLFRYICTIYNLYSILQFDTSSVLRARLCRLLLLSLKSRLYWRPVREKEILSPNLIAPADKERYNPNTAIVVDNKLLSAVLNFLNSSLFRYFLRFAISTNELKAFCCRVRPLFVFFKLFRFRAFRRSALPKACLATKLRETFLAFFRRTRPFSLL